MLNFVIIGNPENRRITLFQKALEKLELPQATVISYLDLIKGAINLTDVVKPNSIVRIDSPGENFTLEQTLLALGANVVEPVKGANFARLSKKYIENLTFDQGLITYPRQWYLGYLEALKIITNQLSSCPTYKLMNTPEDIGLMFDKALCHNLLLQNNIAVPPSLGNVFSFDQLQEKMQEKKWKRVFIKLSNGSSASGVVAYQTNGKHYIATTSTKLVRQDNKLKLYNSLKLNVYRQLREIQELIDALCKHYVHVEKWLPKAGLQNNVFDLRVLVIGKKPSQTVMRTSKSPITNLHLLNKRGNLEELKLKVKDVVWEKAMKLCENTMRVFPKSLYAGIDLMFLPSLKEQRVLEVNAFGDLLPNVLYNQLNSYESEILEMLKTYDQR